MLDENAERQHLASAERAIEAGEARIKAHERLIAHMRSEGHDIAVAESTLIAMKRTLAAFRNTRDVILESLRRIQGETAPRS